MNKLDIKRKLLNLRKARSLTQMQLATLLGVHFTTVEQWEAGRSVPKRTTMIKVAKFFGVSVEKLFFT